MTAVCVTFPLLHVDVIQNVVAALFNERGRVSRAPATLYHMGIQLIKNN